ncbi:MAG: hypothetical protein AD073_000053 [Mycoplasmataceae bacterium]|nr:MAG: hypothetical protein AD073_000053 [Mycoplasmataceae bacterium]
MLIAAIHFYIWMVEESPHSHLAEMQVVLVLDLINLGGDFFDGWENYLRLYSYDNFPLKVL